MESTAVQDEKLRMQHLCDCMRRMMQDGCFDECSSLICKAMAESPDAAEPHNLLGILLEKQGNHTQAMKHFRAAWALDPSCKAARYNMEFFSGWQLCGTCAYDDTDCSPANRAKA